MFENYIVYKRARSRSVKVVFKHMDGLVNMGGSETGALRGLMR